MTQDMLRQEVEDLLLLQRVAQRVNSTLELDTLFEQTMHDVAETFGYCRAAVLLQDETTNDLVITHGWTGDRKRIYQALDNLVSNAMKYACDGPEAEIEIGSTTDDGEVRFFVRDHGPGIAPQYHKKIFGLFQRLESDNRGTGVGLTIVARIMQQHGGRVWVDSDVGKGATFWLAFPKWFTPTEEPEDDIH